MDDKVVEQLAQVLSPLGEERAGEVLAWMQHEAETRALITYCWDGRDPLLFYRVGQKSPMDPNVTIFGMLHWEQPNCIVVFGFELIPGNGGMLVQYHRQLVFNPFQVSGPVSADGLYNELRMFMTGDQDEPEVSGETNGAQEVRQ